MFRKFGFFLLVALSLPVASARECDNFSHRRELLATLADSGPGVNAWFNTRLDRLMTLWNRHGVRPGPADRAQRARDTAEIFQTPWLPELRSPAEDWANEQGNLPRFDVPSRGMYGGDVTREDMHNAWYLPLAGVLKFTPLQNASAPLLIGTDKLGHFFGQGWEYYGTYRRKIGEGVYGIAEKSGVEEARQHGFMLEATTMGLESAGVFSYADLAANWSGFQFYLELVEQASTSSAPLIPRIPIAWIEGRWKRTGSIRMESFLTYDMDEALNPSRIDSSVFWRHVRDNVRRPVGNRPSICEEYRVYPEAFARPTGGAWLQRSTYVSQDSVAGDRAPMVRLMLRLDLLCR